MTDAPRRTTGQERLPKMIGPYAIRERIGKGAMGVVYRAVEETTHAEVALKVMASDLDGDPETRERFFREAHVAGKLRHRNIVSVRDSGEDNGRLYIAMELLRGATLTDVLKGPEALDLEERIDVMIQVCQGLTVAHAAGVFHRDLKPANLFVCEDRRVKILDFGVARLVGSNMTVTGNIIGTPDFMSPEQVRGAEIDGRSDIFSVGSVFYLLLTGRKPFAANDLPAVLNKVVRSQPLPIRETEAPEAIANVIRKAMAKDPAARQQEVSQLACELMCAASGLEVATRQTAIRVQTDAGELTRLATRARELSAALEIAADTTRDGWLAVQEQFPLLRNGVAVLGSFPFRSRVINEVSEAVRTELEATSAHVTRLENAHARFMTGKLLHDKGAHEEALKEFDAARREVPASPVIARAIDASSQAVDQKREQRARLQARLALASQAAERADWEGVLTIVRDTEGADIDPQLARLRDQAVRNIESERARQTRGTSARRPAAAPATANGAAAAQRAQAAIPPPVGSTHPSSAAEETFVVDHSPRTRELREQALRALNSGDLASAERTATEALSLNAADKESRHLVERVRAAVTRRAHQEENGRRIVELLERADALAEAGRFDKALALCDEALQIEPTHEGAVAARGRLADEHAASVAERELDAARQRRLRAATPALQQARRAFEAQDLDRARWCAENALALAPESSEAHALLAEIAAATPAPSPDDTVKLASPGSDETAELAPLQESVPERVRNQASNWIRQWRSADAKTKG